MGTGFSLDPNEYRAAADVIQGYGSAQADNGAALAAGTSTPLSSSGTGIAGAISMIAQGTVQKIVTDVTSTTQGFADDTAAGLRTQAAGAEQLEADIAGHASSVLSDAGSSLSSGYGAMSSLFGTSSPQTTYGSGGAFSTSVGSPPGTNTALGEDPLNAADATALGVCEPGSDGAGAATTGSAGNAGAAGVIGAEEESQQSSAQSLGGMRSSMGGAGAGAAEERGQRPDYLKSRTELTEGDEDPMKAAVEKHRKECGTAPIPFGTRRLLCAKCGATLEVGEAQTLSA